MSHEQTADLQRECRRYRQALDLIWHIAPLPIQSEQQRLERIYETARKALFPDPRTDSPEPL